MSAFWRGVLRFDRAKLEPSLALRNTAGMTLPSIAGAALGRMPAAVAMAIGALNVGFSDSHEPYIRRARRMLAACGLVAAVFAGGVAGGYAPLAVAAASPTASKPW